MCTAVSPIYTQGLIRAVGDPKKRFGEDALRLMRAVRIATQLDGDRLRTEHCARYRIMRGNNLIRLLR